MTGILVQDLQALRRIDTTYVVLSHFLNSTPIYTRVRKPAKNQNNAYNNGHQSIKPTEYR